MNKEEKKSGVSIFGQSEYLTGADPIEEMFALIQRHGHHSSGGVKADFTQAQAPQPTDILKLTSDDLLAQMSPQQRENWQKLSDFIDNWVANQAK